MNQEQYVGKTLREVREMHSRVRVVQAGKVPFAGTCDYRTDRLNVRLGEENLKFKTETRTIGGHEYTFEKVDGSMEDGIVVEAYIG